MFFTYSDFAKDRLSIILYFGLLFEWLTFQLFIFKNNINKFKKSIVMNINFNIFY